MSGGYFEYQQYRLEDIADQIERLIANNGREGEYGKEPEYADDTLDFFRHAVYALRVAQVYAHRIDWLVSGDDSEDDFEMKLLDELEALNERRLYDNSSYL